MKLTFLGADHEVTGSMHLLEACGKTILIDCGMEQGQDVYENAPMPVKYSDVDYILLTHAHIDHAGMIPYAYKFGFHGEVFCTEATKDLSNIMLRDSAHIQMSDAEQKNRKGQRAGKPAVVPIYDLNDAAGVLEHFRGVGYGERVELADGLSIRFIDAGHLLGSASIEIFIREGDVQKKIVFSGDIGNDDKPLIRNPEYIREADYVVMESTYGNRLHGEVYDHVSDLARIIQEALDRRGNVVFPAFAVGRTQELLYLIRHIKQDGLVKGHDGFPVYVDSPLAVEATAVFHENLKDCFDEETRALVEQGINPITFPNLHLSVTADESKAINFDMEPKVIISAAGMCDAGRIRHHLKHNLWRSECSVVFAGYQAVGTLGRVLLDGEDTVKLFGEEIKVRAHIEMMKDMSSHADQAGLLNWIDHFSPRPARIFLTHGTDESMPVLADLIQERIGRAAEAPYSGSSFDLATNAWIRLEAPIPLRDTPEPKTKSKKEKRRKGSAYDGLLAAYEKLRVAVEANKSGTNKDLAAFTSQLENLYSKWT
ncbi:MAG: MBL fold metallo-hydrolase [Lachnospiraceae bacterium]|nr:MBL fold metallo-hydrolase [Lachnospiraceae bacterium]